jgi:hypothetical protein
MNLKIFCVIIVIFMMLIRVTTWNMRGAMYGTSYFENLLEESDVCIVTEHWLNRYNICLFNNYFGEHNLANIHHLTRNFDPFQQCQNHVREYLPLMCK